MNVYDELLTFFEKVGSKDGPAFFIINLDPNIPHRLSCLASPIFFDTVLLIYDLTKNS